MVSALALRGNENIFDLGAGSGYFSFRFATAVPNGKVIAADTEAEMIRHIHHRAMSEGRDNIEARLIQAYIPAVSADSDIVFVCDVLHHVANRHDWLNTIAVSMKSGARLALIEFKEGKLPEGPPEGSKLARTELISLVTGAGLVLDKEYKNILPYQIFLVFHKP